MGILAVMLSVMLAIVQFRCGSKIGYGWFILGNVFAGWFIGSIGNIIVVASYGLPIASAGTQKIHTMH